MRIPSLALLLLLLFSNFSYAGSFRAVEVLNNTGLGVSATTFTMNGRNFIFGGNGLLELRDNQLEVVDEFVFPDLGSGGRLVGNVLAHQGNMYFLTEGGDSAAGAGSHTVPFRLFRFDGQNLFEEYNEEVEVAMPPRLGIVAYNDRIYFGPQLVEYDPATDTVSPTITNGTVNPGFGEIDGVLYVKGWLDTTPRDGGNLLTFDGTQLSFVSDFGTTSSLGSNPLGFVEYNNSLAMSIGRTASSRDGHTIVFDGTSTTVIKDERSTFIGVVNDELVYRNGRADKIFSYDGTTERVLASDLDFDADLVFHEGITIDEQLFFTVGFNAPGRLKVYDGETLSVALTSEDLPANTSFSGFRKSFFSFDGEFFIVAREELSSGGSRSRLFRIVAIPEPTSMVLALGFLGASLLRKRH